MFFDPNPAIVPGFLLPWMASMPATQEQLSAIAMDGKHACNAGARRRAMDGAA